MWISLCLISSFLHITAGCTLLVTNYGEITVYSGQSLLLPCSCTEPHARPHSITWNKLNGEQQPWISIKPSQDSLYRDRVEMFNNTSPGNLSVLLSHITEDDAGWYRCKSSSNTYSDIKLIVKGCTLSVPESTEVNGSPGQSVLLPCSCSETQAKPPSFTWTKLGDRQKPAIILTQSDLYRGRVEMFNNTSPGNLSVLLSELTEDDQGWYRCGISETQMRNVKIVIQSADTVGTSGEAPSASPLQNNTIQYILLAVLPVILMIAGVALYIYKRNKGKNNTGEKSSGSKTGGEKKSPMMIPPLYSTVADRNAGLGDKTTAPDDPSVLYATVQEHRNTNQEETTTPLSAPEGPSVTYSTIIHMTGKGKAAVSLESCGGTEYSSIKTGRFS